MSDTYAPAEKYAAIVFWVLGAAAIAIGVVLAVNDVLLGTIGACAFGAVFLASGFGLWLSRRRRPRAEAGGAAVGAVAAGAVAAGAVLAPEPAEVPGWVSQRADWAAGRIEQDVTELSDDWVRIGGWIAGIGLAASLVGLLGVGIVGGLGVFALFVGGVILLMGLRARARMRKFGLSVIHSRTVPARRGGRFQGIVQTGVPLNGHREKEFRVRLQCVRQSTSGTLSSETKSTSHDILWTHDEVAKGSMSSVGPSFQVPLDLALPDDLPSSTPPGDHRTYWELTLRASTPGVDYAARFEIPVVR